ncbi:DUF4388 domain-containing protein [Desulfotalea psychrophila]|nr:DUF4388 domain-containing protein [Desulfotalea psychrophila]
MLKKPLFFRIIEQKNCPIYAKGEQFFLSEKSFSSPAGKDACLILVRNLIELLFQLRGQSRSETEGLVFNCSGCVGLIKYKIIECREKRDVDLVPLGVSLERIIEGAYGFDINSPFLRALSVDGLDGILEKFKFVELCSGAVLMQKGKRNSSLYLLLEGELLVEDGGFILGRFSAGDICGEMSYLGADLAVSTIRSSRASRLLAIGSSDFAELVFAKPAVQLFMAKLMAQRLARSNAERSRDLQSCMSGRLDTIAAAELLQIFHMNQKTGMLFLALRGGQASVFFLEGSVVRALYKGLVGKEAFFAILVEKKGRYRFTTGLSQEDMKSPVIGDFMSILLEGIQQVDEAEPQGSCSRDLAAIF